MKTYSGGQRRKLDIAIGMVHSPKILFRDEPTTGLDPVSRSQLWVPRKLRRSRDRRELALLGSLAALAFWCAIRSFKRAAA